MKMIFKIWIQNHLVAFIFVVFMQSICVFHVGDLIRLKDMPNEEANGLVGVVDVHAQDEGDRDFDVDDVLVGGCRHVANYNY